MNLRLCKLVLLANVCAYLALVVFNNLTDYGSNFQFVRHVIRMDTTFPGNAGMWRAIESPAAIPLFYGVIISWEAATCALICAGTWRLWRARSAPAAAWRKARNLAAAGLVLSMTQWFFGFIAVGGEWFLMWQSKVWNGQDAALRSFLLLGLVLVFLCLGEGEEAPA
jgi:predicted small integral membrane protein